MTEGEVVTLIVDPDCIAVGLTKYLADTYGISDITATSTRSKWLYKLQFNWTSRFGAQTYTQDWYDEVVESKRPGYANRDVTNVFIRALERATTPEFKVFVEVLIGKYKGSIGSLTFRGIDLGKDSVSGSGVTIPLLSTKNMRFAPEATHPHLVYEKITLDTKDSFGNKNEIGDIIVFVDNGLLNFGVYIDDDTVDRRIVLKVMIGTKLRREYLKPSRNMMNVSKMPSSKISTQIFKAQLVAE